MTPLASRTFTLDDQQQFAALSGDFNPVHVDPVRARRTVFGGAVVHGVHVVLWALDRAWAEGGGPAIATLKATFHQPMRVGERVDLVVFERTAEGLGLGLQLEGGQTAATIRVGWGARGDTDAQVPSTAFPPGEPADLDFPAAAAAAGTFPLACDRARAQAMFPALARELPAVALAELLATTRVVGMACPGLHSLFAGLEVTASAGAPDGALSYRILRAERAVSMIDIAVRGPSFAGKLRTFVRPRPQAQVGMAEVARRIRPGELAGLRALIVGGSRGIGETTAKCVAAGGGHAAVTYHRGSDDAARVCAEITAAGGRAFALRFDALAPPDDLAAALEPLGPPTHLYYFATPFISIDKGRAFSPALFREFCRHYVDGFAETVRAARALGQEPLTVVYPSTVFLDERPPGAAEYCAAKAAGEEVCRWLEKTLPGTRVVAPRLPRLRTDQTASILNVAARDTLDVVVEMLRATG